MQTVNQLMALPYLSICINICICIFQSVLFCRQSMVPCNLAPPFATPFLLPIYAHRISNHIALYFNKHIVCRCNCV